MIYAVIKIEEVHERSRKLHQWISCVSHKETIQYLTICGLANTCSTADVTYVASMNTCHLYSIKEYVVKCDSIDDRRRH